MVEGVQFKEWHPQYQATAVKYSFITRLLMKLSGGLIKTQAQANIIMIVLSIIFIALAWYGGFGGESAPATDLPVDDIAF